jgi:hypothetical protein
MTLTEAIATHRDQECPICRNYCPECSRDLRISEHAERCESRRPGHETEPIQLPPRPDPNCACRKCRAWVARNAS